MSSAVLCLVIAVVAVVLGHSAIADALAGFAKLLFVLGSATRLQAANPIASEMM